jgi:hypothetical protein
MAGLCEHSNETSSSLKTGNFLVRLQVVTAASIKAASFWDTGPCSPVEFDRRFGSA